jgi:hypothetical protein
MHVLSATGEQRRVIDVHLEELQTTFSCVIDLWQSIDTILNIL